MARVLNIPKSVGTTSKETIYKREMESGIKALKKEQAEKLLQEIPVEELTKVQPGIRTKLLSDAGYTTLGELRGVTISRLTVIDGISQEMAQTIITVSKQMIQEAEESQKIHLSSDDRTAAAGALVLAVSRYRNLKASQKGTEPLRSNITEEESWEDFSENSIQFFNILEEIAPGAFGNEDQIYGLPEDLATEVNSENPVLVGLNCTLRRYQEWGVKYILRQGRVLLGDEMGLGKTVQAIASMVALTNEGGSHFIVVCPASVLSNWVREIAKHSTLRVTEIHGDDKGEELSGWLEYGGVAVTTYETTGFLQLEENYRYAMLVVDEAHYIKNPEAKRTKNVTELANHAERMLFMTGTAMENRVEEMVQLFNILDSDMASEIKGMTYLSSAPKFREKIAPVYYRRRRDDVLTELPELIESTEWAKLESEEKKVYEKAVLEGKYAEARRVSWNVEDMENSSKARRLKELVQEAESDGRKVIVFSFFLDTMEKLKNLLGEKAVGPINGSVPPARRQEIIDEFDKAPEGSVLLAQIQAGGTGLNIQSASVVILCEPQFKPSIENQAIARAYRMGQTRNVLVYRLLSENTVDERIMGLLEQKQKAFDAFADLSEAADKDVAEMVEVDETSFGQIMKEEAQRIQEEKETTQPVAAPESSAPENNA